MDEKTLMDIRNSYWKESEAQWCLVVDADELVDVRMEFLLNSRASMVRCTGYEMFGTEEDTIDTLIYGCPSLGYCKPVLFRPATIKETNFAPGSHSANPISIDGSKNEIWENVVDLYHTKWRSWTNGIERAHLLAKRRSEHSRLQGWNIHYEFDDSVHQEYFSNGHRDKVKVR